MLASSRSGRVLQACLRASMAMLWLAVACSSPPAGQSTDDTTVLPKDTIGPQLDGQDSSDATDEPDVPQQQP
jgi:hypothetical protein